MRAPQFIAFGVLTTMVTTMSTLADVPVWDGWYSALAPDADPFGIGGIAGPASYATSFDSGQGYVTGNLSGQQGWGVSASGINTVKVQNVNPFSGDQHISLIKDPAISTGVLRGAFSPNQGAGPVGPSTMSLMVNISNTGGARYDVIPQAPSQGFLTARVVFNFDGSIFVLDDADGPGPGGLAFVDTTFDWTPGAYKNLTIEADPVADTLKYYYDGTLIYNNPLTGMFAGTRMEQIVILADNFQLANERGDFDDLIVTPAPGAVALLGLAGAFGSRRRRRE